MNGGFKHQGTSGNNEFVFFSESPDQRRITCGGTQNNYDSSGNISSNHEMKIEVLPSGTVNFYWDGSTTPLHTCTGASGDYRVYFGGYAGNSSGGIATTVTYEGDITTAKDLDNISGLSKGSIRKRIIELIKTGDISQVKEIGNEINVIQDLSNIYGVGPSKANELINEHEVTSIDDLRNKYEKDHTEI